MKHNNPFGCLSDGDDDKDNNKAPIVDSALVSTTVDEISNTIGMNDDAFCVSTNLGIIPIVFCECL